MTPTLDITPAVKPELRLVPTPMLRVSVYLVGDFLRAWGSIDESTIRTAQAGFEAGDFSHVSVQGRNFQDIIVAETEFSLDEILRQGEIALDLSGTKSVTGQISRNMERGILHCVAEMRRRGLRITYGFRFTVKGSADPGIFVRYNLTPSNPAQYAPGMRVVFEAYHRPTGTRLRHSTAWGV